MRLAILLKGFDPKKPDPTTVHAIVSDKEVLDALRYAAGPPISSDDLGVLVTATTKRLTKTDLTKNPKLAADTLKLICAVADRFRFPWVAAGRKPTRREISFAVKATATLHATQSLSTERKRYGRVVEKALANELISLGYKKVKAPNKGKINVPVHFPAARTFFGECSLKGRRADLLIGLDDGRVIAAECKDSSSAVNSVKRVLNDTAAKAKGWVKDFGGVVVPVAVLSGVFGVDNLKTAQADGLYLVWAEGLASFIDWLKSTHA